MLSEAYQKSQYGNYPDLTGVTKILVIKMRHLGDVLLTSPIFPLLKKAMPKAQIDCLLNVDTVAMLEGEPSISNFHLFDRKKRGFFNEFSFYRKIRKEKYDLVINLTEGDRGAWVSLVSGAPLRIGFATGLKKDRFYSHLVKGCPTPRHAVEINLDALRRMGIFPNEEERELNFVLPEESYKKIPFEKGGYIVIHPASRWRFKCWKEESMAALIAELSSFGNKIVLSCSPDPIEREMVDRIIALSKSDVVNMAGKLSLKELGALIAQSKGLITVDSVPLHMASALKTPTVVLFGPSSEKVWGPWKNPRSQVVAMNYTCRSCNLDGCGGSKVSDCLQSLPLNSVLSALRKVQIIA